MMLNFHNYYTFNIFTWPQKAFSWFVNTLLEGKTIKKIIIGGTVVYSNLSIISYINSKTNKKILLNLKNKFTDAEIIQIKKAIEEKRKIDPNFQLIHIVQENNEGANLLNIKLKEMEIEYDLGPKNLLKKNIKPTKK